MEDSALVLEIVIENPVGSTTRIVHDPERGWVEVEPAFSTPIPAEYGYLPGTYNPADGDPVDAMVIRWGPTFPGCRYTVRAVGLLLRADGDHKVLAVPHTPEFVSPVCDLPEVDPELLRRIEDWFRPHFVLLGWRDARWALEWVGACRALASGGAEESRETRPGMSDRRRTSNDERQT